MDLALALLITLVCLGATVYAHVRMPYHSPGQGWGARIILVVTGIAFGYVMATHYIPMEGFMYALVFLSAFGLVHVPAAAILFLKRQRAKA